MLLTEHTSTRRRHHITNFVAATRQRHFIIYALIVTTVHESDRLLIVSSFFSFPLSFKSTASSTSPTTHAPCFTMPSLRRVSGRPVLCDGNLTVAERVYLFGELIEGPLPMASSEVDMKFLGTFAVRLEPSRFFCELWLWIMSRKHVAQLLDQLTDFPPRKIYLKTTPSSQRTSFKSSATWLCSPKK